MTKIDLEQFKNGGQKIIGDREYMTDAKGALVPVENIKGQYILEDQTVRQIAYFAQLLSEQIARFKAHTFDDISAFEGILSDEYDATVGGKKGNKTLSSYDGLFKVTVQIADRVEFGPELQVAKSLIDECLTEWSADSRTEIRAIITRAFNVDKEGQINRSEIYTLLRLEITDPRWQKAMTAIRDAMRVVGSKSYVRCYRRATNDGAWEPITIDLAKA